MKIVLLLCLLVVSGCRGSQIDQKAPAVSLASPSPQQSTKVATSSQVKPKFGAGARDPRQFWRDTFHRDKEPEKDRGEEEGESRPPQKVSGIGDEAFWMTSPAAGILYVLKGSSFVRISIGGREDQQTKIKKSKALAQKVIDRL